MSGIIDWDVDLARINSIQFLLIIFPEFTLTWAFGVRIWIFYVAFAAN
jgi:hypothetical protein